MGIYNFEGETYVAFIDISGFKHMMNDKERVADVVYKFYQSGYNILKKYLYGDERKQAEIQGIFVSDCGILFINRNHQDFDIDLEKKRDSLNLLLNVIKEMNIRMIDIDVMLTTSIAYGSLKCTEKLEFKGISKNPFYGDAYLSAFLDNESHQIKIQPGECRIVIENLPNDLISKESKLNYENFKLLKQGKKKTHYYFYWMLKEKSKMSEIDKKLSKLKDKWYKTIAKLIKAYLNNN